MTDAVDFRVATTPTRVGFVVVHGVGEATPGWMNDALIGRIESDTRSADLRFEGHCELHQFDDRARSTKGAKFPAHLRRTPVAGGASVSVAEFYWADLSRVGSGPFTHSLALLMLFFEAPMVLAGSLLRQSRTGIQRLISGLLLFPNWLVRWPIAGLTVALFVSGWVFVVLGILGLSEDMLAGKVGLVLMLALPVLVAVSIALARGNVHKNLGPTDLGLSTAVCGTLFFLYVVFQTLVMPMSDVSTPVKYFLHMAPLLAVAWGLWWISVMLALVMLLLVQLKRLVWRRPSANLVPMSRPWAALGLSITQELAWRLVVAPLAILTIGALDPCIAAPEAICNHLSDDQRSALFGFLLFESDNFLLCLAAVLVIATAVFLVSGWRRLLTRRIRADTTRTVRRMPRLIVNPLVMTGLVLALVLQIVMSNAVFQNFGTDPRAVLSLQALMTLFGREQKLFDPTQLVITSAGMWFLIMWLFAIRKLHNVARGGLHIARELIDHQYSPRFGYAGVVLAKSKHERQQKLQRSRRIYPRRNRILERMEALVEGLVERERYDRLVFLGHSQGTVIIHDYLRSSVAAKALDIVPEVHVITLGSPLTHLYQHYFHEYGRQNQWRTGLHPHVRSWTNLWRVDDPIGHMVKLAGEIEVNNVPIAAGGHTDYWRSPEVCDVIMRVARGQLPFTAQAGSAAPTG